MPSTANTILTTERERRLASFVSGDLEDAVIAAQMAADADELRGDPKGDVLTALTLLKRAHKRHRELTGM